jgi:acylphosphatase
MYKCLKISFSATNIPENFLRNHLLKKAKTLELEGTAQMVKTENIIRVILYGFKEGVDKFVDFLQQGPGSVTLENLEVEPSIKERDFRGAFRIIE